MKQVLIPLAPGCEEMEAVTLIDILRRGEIDVVTAGLTDAPLTASRGVVLVADTTLDNAMAEDRCDMVLIPGGMGGATALAEHKQFLAYLKQVHESGRHVGAICAAPMILGKAGLLDNRTFTAYPGVVDAAQFSNATNTGNAVEMDGRIFTSRGPGTALDFALAVLEALAGEDTRNTVEEQLTRC